MTVFQMIPIISITSGQPTILLPLSFVIFVSMVKDVIEDYKRHVSDSAENNRKVLCIPQEDQIRRIRDNRNGEIFREMPWHQIRVGQICKVRCDEFLPADMVLLGSNDPQGICFVETKNLDGETNLKLKLAHKWTAPCTGNDEDVFNFNGEISCQGPNEYLYKFEGNLMFKPAEKEFLKEDPTYDGGDVKISLDANQILLRGSSLRNTEFAYGVVIYTGHESKIMKNSAASRVKKSSIEIKTNYLIIFTFALQIVSCVFAAIYSALWNNAYKDPTDTYLCWSKSTDAVSNSILLTFVVNMGTWLLIFSGFVPISLLVTLEIVKFMQAIFITFDAKIYDEEKDMPTKVQSSNLNEELGKIEYIFSDKTGTLTKNIMEFKKMCIGNFAYGGLAETTEFSSDEISSYKLSGDSEDINIKHKLAKAQSLSSNNEENKEDKIPNVCFEDRVFYEHKNNKLHENCQNIHNFILHLALCHTTVIETKNGVDRIAASSPDELALVNAAKFFGYSFKGRDKENNILVEYQSGEIIKYELLNVIEFDSTRKRMTIIVRLPDNTIKVMCKGADSIIQQRLSDKTYLDQTQIYLERYASEGLRTLLLAEKIISEEDYNNWNMKYLEASLATENREDKMNEVGDEIEYDFYLVGATAIEDRLQDDVAETIHVLKEAGIKIWVLTGDKIETAINIGYSCKVLNNYMEQYIINETDPDKISDQLMDAHKNYRKSKRDAHGLILGGDSLLKITEDEYLCEDFISLAEKMKVIIACRVSPKQKAEIVQLVKIRHPEKVTLAIGDGANDVNMITTAHIGVGISGLEGQQAARASDYAIGQFKFLRTLILVHGRESYRK